MANEKIKRHSMMQFLTNKQYLVDTQGGVYNAGKKSGKNEYPFLFLGGEENGNPFQYSCLENPMDRGA